MSTSALAPTTITMTVPGVLTTSSICSMRMPFSGTITSAAVAVTGAPAGSALTAALLNSALSAATFSIAAAGTSAAGTVSGTAANVTFAAGDLVHLDVLTVGSSTAGTGITVAFTVVEG